MSRLFSTLQGHDLGRIQNTYGHQLAVLTRGSVVAERILALGHLGHDHGIIDAGVLSDLTSRRFQGAAENLDTDVVIVVCAFQLVQYLAGAYQGDAATGHDTLFHRRTQFLRRTGEWVLVLLIQINMHYSPSDSVCRFFAKEFFHTN